MTDNPIRNERGHFLPGNIANPTGRPKTPNLVKDLLKEATPRAMQVMVELLENDNPKLRFQAAQEVLNRSLGKPVQAVDLKATVDQGSAHLAALQSLAAAVTPHMLAEVLTIDAEPLASPSL
ncbi:hypothetical protein SAMN04488498_12384 [Mesorhizobium albiziae]|uniref:DUF5681 domain-containing protein n=1 Tax=Neomesorhizobium albiziae TaxID=335020 RepID=A0A1I4E7U7_9HYPH|nr:hypothetical protein [Mesorhizobium albiziae]GLS33792.1 hypothetical protein GCM10007937_55050 [Mesorhizobium albiziae]SFL01842.1 hypothetical protein SAMN04488498_12384 [Mesorhizobium albiziae]